MSDNEIVVVGDSPQIESVVATLNEPPDPLRNVVSDALHVYHQETPSRSYQGMADAVLAAIRAAGWAVIEDTDDRHLVNFTPDGSTVKHPVSCRPNLFACPMNKAARALDGPPAGLGVWSCEVAGDGSLRLLDKVGDPA